MRIVIITDREYVYLHPVCSLCAFTIITQKKQNGAVFFDERMIMPAGISGDALMHYVAALGPTIIITGYLSEAEKSFFSDKGIRTITGITGAVSDIREWVFSEIIPLEERPQRTEAAEHAISY